MFPRNVRIDEYSPIRIVLVDKYGIPNYSYNHRETNHRERRGKMLPIVLGMVAVVCATGWFFSRLSVKIILCYMKEKGYAPPTDAELKTCTRKVTEGMFSHRGK